MSCGAPHASSALYTSGHRFEAAAVLFRGPV